MRAGPSKTDKAPKLPRAPKQLQLYVREIQVAMPQYSLVFYRQDFQFFPARLAELQEQELAYHKKINEIPATVDESQAGEDASPEKLEEERKAAQEVIDNGKPVPTSSTRPAVS